MKRNRLLRELTCFVLVLGAIGVCSSRLSGDSPVKEEAPEERRDPLPLARERAKLADEIYSASLHMMHHRYFVRDTSAVPARAMEDVFKEMSRNNNVHARWISVNAKPMSIDHEPKDDFEKQAVRALAKGENFEQIADGEYRRATPIPLGGGCLHCHGSFGGETKTKRFAGLVIRIPLAETP